MPLHDFKCTKCGHQFEDLLGVKDPDPVCPECGAPVERMLTSIHLGKKDKPMGAKADHFRNLGYNEAKGRYKKKEP